MKENGKIIIWKDLAYIFGTMVESMKDSIKMIKSMVLGCTPGLMVDVMRDIGSRVNNMVSVLT